MASLNTRLRFGFFNVFPSAILKRGLSYVHENTSSNLSTGSFYRRPLPSTCIAFSSPEGRTLFEEAMSEGNMEAYFNLAEQFSTQDEPAYCGLSSLTIVLNALEIDPGRTWKQPWRWFHESMLDCCVPLELIKSRGTSYAEIAGLARCHGAACSIRTASEGSVDDFRSVVQHIMSGKHGRSHLVINYDRHTLGQTGSGHFSPVGSYNRKQDMVLVMDTARFKYPPHWVPLGLIWEAMRTVDVQTGKGRGYLVFYRQERKGLVFTICRSLHHQWSEFPKWWNKTLESFSALVSSSTSTTVENDNIILEFICTFVNQHPEKVVQLIGVQQIENNDSVEYQKNLPKISASCLRSSPKVLVSALSDSTVFKMVSSLVTSEYSSDPQKVVDHRHMISVLILSCALSSAMNLRAIDETEKARQLLSLFDMLSIPQLLLNDIEHLSKSLQLVADGGAVSEVQRHCLSSTCPVDFHTTISAKSHDSSNLCKDHLHL